LSTGLPGQLNQAVHLDQHEIEVEELTAALRRATAFLSLLLHAHSNE
jgi:hypothetical protein